MKGDLTGPRRMHWQMVPIILDCCPWPIYVQNGALWEWRSPGYWHATLPPEHIRMIARAHLLQHEGGGR